jgi:hypothetical protein
MFSLQLNWRRWQNRFCLEVKGVGRKADGRRERWPNNVYTYE